MSSITLPDDRRALVAIDLGAESCRVSLLQWIGNLPRIEMVHRIANGPVTSGEHLHWPLDRILAGLEEGLRKAAELAPDGIRSIAVDGWAVDNVRLDANPKAEAENGRRAQPIHQPYCYRDERTVASKAAAEVILTPEQFFALTGAQPLRINTVFQLLADHADGVAPATPWLLLPEYVLYWLGGRPVAEYTNATHTGLVDIETGNWRQDVFARLGLSIEAAPEIVPSGTNLGHVRGKLALLPAFRETALIAPACHDTASAIASIAQNLENSAYIVSGTWSLVGTVIAKPVCSAEAEHAGFTNQGAAAGGYCFHTNVNGMWILKQCLDHWTALGRSIELTTLITEAAEVKTIPGLIDVDASPLLLTGEMPQRINHELEVAGFSPISDEAGNEPIFARIIFASLAARYAAVLRNLEQLTGRRFERITVLGGGSRNKLLARLAEETSGLPVIAGEVEGSTLGNFAVQLAAGAGAADGDLAAVGAEHVRSWAAYLASTTQHPKPQGVTV